MKEQCTQNDPNRTTHHATLGQFLNHTGTPRVPSDALPPPARVPGTHHSLHSATLALTARVCGACHALLLRQCPDGTCTHRERCVECTPRAGATRAHLRPPAGSILGTWISDPVRITPQALQGRIDVCVCAGSAGRRHDAYAARARSGYRDPAIAVTVVESRLAIEYGITIAR